MTPCTDGTRLLAVHKPHTGGVLHGHRIEGNRLVGRAVAQNVSTHRMARASLIWRRGWARAWCCRNKTAWPCACQTPAARGLK